MHGNLLVVMCWFEVSLVRELLTSLEHITGTSGWDRLSAPTAEDVRNFAFDLFPWRDSFDRLEVYLGDRSCSTEAFWFHNKSICLLNAPE